jgi:hypothetical protein
VSQAVEVQGDEVEEVQESEVGKAQEVEVVPVEVGRTGPPTESNKGTTTAAAGDAAITTAVTGANKVSTYVVC